MKLDDLHEDILLVLFDYLPLEDILQLRHLSVRLVGKLKGLCNLLTWILELWDCSASGFFSCRVPSTDCGVWSWIGFSHMYTKNSSLDRRIIQFSYQLIDKSFLLIFIEYMLYIIFLKDKVFSSGFLGIKDVIFFTKLQVLWINQNKS